MVDTAALNRRATRASAPPQNLMLSFWGPRWERRHGMHVSTRGGPILAHRRAVSGGPYSRACHLPLWGGREGLLADSDSQTVLDRLRIGVVFFEFLAGAFHVAAQLLQVLAQLHVHVVLQKIGR